MGQGGLPEKVTIDVQKEGHRGWKEVTRRGAVGAGVTEVSRGNFCGLSKNLTFRMTESSSASKGIGGFFSREVA